MKLKACGLSNADEVKFCIENKVSYCGFILNYKKSHRFISLEVAKALTNIKKEKTKFVGVLVEPSYEELEIYSNLNLDYFQLYGKYNSNRIAEIKKKFNKKIITAVQVNQPADIQKYKIVEKNSDIILWDSSGYEKSLSWDFSLLKSVSSNVEKMVAGNITIDKLNYLVNLADIVDVSGALETNKVKDINKIKKFVTKIKEINDAY